LAALDVAGLGVRTRAWAGTTILGLAALANLVWGGQLDGHLVYGGDYHTYYVGALVGVQHGWASLFDVNLQAHAWQASPGAFREFLPYLNTPPTAWVLTPLLGFGYGLGYGIFVALMAAAAIAVAVLVGTNWRDRLLVGLAGASTWVLVMSLASGQNAILGALAVVLCWRLIAVERRVLAGVALSMVALRPNAAFLVPLALLAAGERRVFLAWLGATLVLGMAVVASLGTHGLQQFADLAVVVRRSFPSSTRLTLQYVLGPGAVAWGLQLVAGLTAAILGARRARGNPALVIAAGLLGSLLLSPYLHVQDFLPPLAIMVVLVVRQHDQAAIAILLLLLLVAPPGWALGAAWPATFIAVELVWLGWLLTRGRDIHRKFPVFTQKRHSLLGEA